MMTLLLAVAGLVGSPGGGQSDAGSTYAVRAKHLRMFGGEVIANGVLVVEGSQVKYAGDAQRAGKLPDDVIDHDGWLSAGLVACRSYSGTRGDLIENKRAMTAEARIADVVDMNHSDFKRALASGITSMVVAPWVGNVANGSTAVVKTNGSTVLAREAHLHLGFSSDALRFNRFPTSYTAAIGELETQFAHPKGVWERVATGKLPVMFDAVSREEIWRALQFAGEHKLKGALSRATWAGELAADVKKSGLAVVAGPFGIGEPERSLTSVVALAKEGVPLAFAVDAPWNSDASLRMSAAMCMRAGLDAKVAWEALTSTAAGIAGVSSRVGKLSPGLDADFVLWSGDPLDLSSRVMFVYVDGARAFGGGE